MRLPLLLVAAALLVGAAPKKLLTPNDIVTRLNRETVKALRSDDIRASLAAQGTDTVGNSPAEFTAHIRNELAKWQQAVKDAAIKPE